jgi:hypothetical protein
MLRPVGYGPVTLPSKAAKNLALCHLSGMAKTEKNAAAVALDAMRAPG